MLWSHESCCDIEIMDGKCIHHFPEVCGDGCGKLGIFKGNKLSFKAIRKSYSFMEDNSHDRKNKESSDYPDQKLHT